MSELPSNGVNDHTTHLATNPIGTGGVGPDRELRRLRHGQPPRLAWTLRCQTGQHQWHREARPLRKGAVSEVGACAIPGCARDSDW